MAEKTVKELFRNRRGLGITLGLPMAFMIIFGLAFASDDGNTTFDVAVVNHDAGERGDQFVNILAGLAYEDGTPILELHPETEDAAGEALVRQGDASALLVIPVNFTEALEAQLDAYRNRQQQPVPGLPGQDQEEPSDAVAGVVIAGNPGDGGYNTAARILEAVLREYVSRFAPVEPRVHPEPRSMAVAEATAYDYIVPGLMVFAIINAAPQVAALLSKEEEFRTLTRLRLSRMGARHLMGGVTLAQFALAVVSVALMFVAAKLMGFHNAGSIPLALGIALLATLPVLGLGLVIASFARTQEEAASLGALIAVPASFLSGAFFPIPGVHLFTWGGRAFELYDVLPTTHAVKAMSKVLTFGAGVDEVTFDLAMLAVLSAAFFLAGVALYARRRLQAA